MTKFIFVNFWMQKDRYRGLNEYCALINEVCTGKSGVELFGIFRPLNESWNWAYIIRTDDFVKWKQIDDEINVKYRGKRGNITQTMTRIYTAKAETSQPENMGVMKYFLEEMEVWDGWDIGLIDWYNLEVKVFDKKEGIWFMGLYQPWNSTYHWTHFMMFDEIHRQIPIARMCNDAYGRQERTLSNESKLYERYEPD
jgi:hypothetical protein